MEMQNRLRQWLLTKASPYRLYDHAPYNNGPFRADEIRRLKREYDQLPPADKVRRKDEIAADIDDHLAYLRLSDPTF